MCEGGEGQCDPKPCVYKEGKAASTLGNATCPGSTEACSFLKHPCSSISKSLLGGWGWGISSEPGQAFWLFLVSAIVCVPVEEQMPGAFADENTGCTSGLQNCSLPKALCFWLLWFLFNSTSTSLIL